VKEQEIKESKNLRSKDIKSLLLAENQVFPEDALQIFVHKLETVAWKYGLQIIRNRTKTMDFTGRHSARSKVVIHTVE
jgi:hypothetical protein